MNSLTLNLIVLSLFGLCMTQEVTEEEVTPSVIHKLFKIDQIFDYILNV